MTEPIQTTAQPLLVGERLRQIKTEIAAIAHAAGRDPAAIKLIAVSKRKPVTDIIATYDAGQRAFGENTVQEAREKIPQIDQTDIDWHFIGHLQKNKAKLIPGLFHWLHSLDNLGLAEKLSRYCEQQATTLKTLIQVNIDRDPNKQGVLPHQLLSFIEKLLDSNLTALDLRGLMTIGIQTDDHAVIHQSFADLRKLKDQCRQQFGLSDFNELSMGMSGDYPLAIKEGATMVRLGTAIFGERQV